MTPMADDWEDLLVRSQKNGSRTSFDELVNSEPKSSTDASLRSLQAEDVVIALIGGFAGALSSYALTDTFNKVHGYSDSKNKGALEWYGKESERAKHPILHRLAKLLRHPSSPMDAIDGRYGTINHRLKYGHDLFNPFEVWDKLTKEYGGNFGAALEWVRHLIADTFTPEGLPLPGHSHFRELILEQLGRDWTKYLTIKARDVTGAALVSGILSGHDAYLRFVKKVDTKNTYARYQRNMAAYGTCLISGLMLGSLNYAALVLLAKNSIQLVGVDRRISRELDQSLDQLAKQIEAPPHFGAPFAEMIEEPHGQNYTVEEYSPFVGDVPLDGNVLILT